MARIVTTGKGRRWVQGGHPWIYADDLAQAEAQPGELAPIFGPNEEPLGWGLYSSASRIAVRLVSRRAEQPNRAFWLELVQRAIATRDMLGLLEPNGTCRLISGDSEHLPGLVVDRYADVLVVQSGCQGSDRLRDFLIELVCEVLPFEPRAILDRSDSGVRRLEQLEPRVEWVRGEIDGLLRVEEPDELVYEVDLVNGHKTGHYLDQRDNRAIAGSYATIMPGSEGRVLDAFCYDGLFGIQAARRGAEQVLCLDQSAACEERVLRNAELNGVSDRITFAKANAMHDLRRRASEDEKYDLVVVDPPAFARNRKEVQGAERGYRELNVRAMHLVETGGHLVTASCSFAIGRETFQRILAESARDAQRDAYLLHLAGAAHDHPISLALPESNYLKCAFLRVV
ncbi:Ribosomal RNA large subunit methyltransferase I [Planctomycetes bacterium Pla163]|uniref:Ribosomal RNA large subunit methyltransferase I n=1 Tax=Rohdeia mirabilis TaxID=2528008 RepID=A0A518CZF7_9BACT|nr:Ribosomal RNA large subunit methyltransferase I [Planctomycetes bacterium Pla163]